MIAGTQNQPTENHFAVGKVDHRLDATHTLSGTYNFDQGERSPFGILGDLGAQGTESSKHVISAKWTSVLSSASVNEIHVGYADSKPGGNIPLSNIDFAEQGLVFRTDRTRMGEINVPGVNGIGYRVDAQENRQRSYTVKDGYSLTHGNHSFRIGGEWTYFRYAMASCSRGCNGVWEFGSLEDTLLGIPQRFEILLPGGDIIDRDMRQHLLGAYFQDNWRIRRNLTFNLGVR